MPVDIKRTPVSEPPNTLPVAWQIVTTKPPEIPLLVIQRVYFRYDLLLPDVKKPGVKEFQGTQDYVEFIGVIPPGSTMPVQYGHPDVIKKWFKFFHPDPKDPSKTIALDDPQLVNNANLHHQTKFPLPTERTFQQAQATLGRAPNVQPGVIYHDIYDYKVPPGTRGFVEWRGDLRAYELNPDVIHGMGSWTVSGQIKAPEVRAAVLGPRITAGWFAKQGFQREGLPSMNQFRDNVWNNDKVPYVGDVVTVRAVFPSGQVTVGMPRSKP